jgi:lactoylglutathione lyase
LRLDYLVLYTKCPDSLAAFYRDGLGLADRLSRFDGRYVEFHAGGITLAICDYGLRAELLPELSVPEQRDGHGELHDSGSLHQLSFAVDDVGAAARRAVASGAALISPPAVRPWRCEVAIIRDPEGRMIEFCRRLD